MTSNAFKTPNLPSNSRFFLLSNSRAHTSIPFTPQLKSMPVNIPIWQNAVYLQPVIRHSSKIYEFFGITPSATPAGISSTATSIVGGSSSSQSRMLPIQRQPISPTRSDNTSDGLITTATTRTGDLRPLSAAASYSAMASGNDDNSNVYGQASMPHSHPDMITPAAAAAPAAAVVNGNANPTHQHGGATITTTTRPPLYTLSGSYVEEGTQTNKTPSPVNDLTQTPFERRMVSFRTITKRLVQSCTPVWFSIPTSLAFLSFILRLLPSTISISFSGIITISTVLFLASLVVYALMSVLFIVRLLSPPNIRLRHRSMPLIERDSFELGFLPYWPAGFALSAVAFGSFAVAEGRVVNRTRWAVGVYVCWWISAIWMAVTGFFILTVYMSHSTVLVRSKTAPGRGAPLIAILGAVTGCATIALVGGIMCLPGSGVLAGFDAAPRIISDGMAGPVIVFSYCGVGGVLLFAVMVYAVVLHELLLVTGWPPPELTAVIIYLVGPLSQCAAALVVLGEAASSGHYLGDLDPSKQDYPRSGVGVPTAEDSTIQRKFSSSALGGVPIDVVSIVLALLLIGMAVIWLVIAVIGVGNRLLRGELVWNSTWNGAVFPLATFAATSLWLSFELHSSFLRVLTCVFLIICFIIFAVNIAFIFKLALRSSIFRPGASADGV